MTPRRRRAEPILIQVKRAKARSSNLMIGCTGNQTSKRLPSFQLELERFVAAEFSSHQFLKGKQMNKDHIKGAVDQAKGSIKQAVGTASCDTKLKVEGTLEKAKGKLESAVGDAKDAIRKL